MTAISSPNYRWRVGEVEITRVLEFEAALFEPAVIHPEASPEIIARHRTWLEPTLMDPASGLLVFAFQSTVIRTPRATILVDTCSGNDKERPHKLRYHKKNWPYLANLAAAGSMREDIDYVLCTHLHADHVGWNTRLVGRWGPTFSNARYLFVRREWEHWREAELRAAYTTDPYYENSLLPVMDSGQAELVATDYAFADGPVMVIPAHSRPQLAVGYDRMMDRSASFSTASAKAAGAGNRVPPSMFDAIGDRVAGLNAASADDHPTGTLKTKDYDQP